MDRGWPPQLECPKWRPASGLLQEFRAPFLAATAPGWMGAFRSLVPFLADQLQIAYEIAIMKMRSAWNGLLRLLDRMRTGGCGVIHQTGAYVIYPAHRTVPPNSMSARALSSWVSATESEPYQIPPVAAADA